MSESSKNSQELSNPVQNHVSENINGKPETSHSPNETLNSETNDSDSALNNSNSALNESDTAMNVSNPALNDSITDSPSACKVTTPLSLEYMNSMCLRSRLQYLVHVLKMSEQQGDEELLQMFQDCILQYDLERLRQIVRST